VTDALTFPLHPRRLVAGSAFGAMRSRIRGAGLDLVGSRPYRPGDDVRRIDWHASARLSARQGSDEFVVREHLTDEATEVVVAVDRSPSMALSPPWLPWLRKADAAREAAALIHDSALAAACAATHLDGEPGGSIGDALDGLLAARRGPPPGALVFALSDFLAPPDERWQAALGRGWDLVPVAIQDPLWERSFPDVAGALLPLADPATGRVRATRLSAGEVAARRLANERRFEQLVQAFHALGLDWVVLASSDRGHVYEAFVDWAHGRHRGARVAR
jgi:uncharacterized protein (DUF58 family)